MGSCGDRGGSSADGEGPHSGSGAGDQDSNGDPSAGARKCKGLQVGVSSPACDISGAEASDDATAAALNAEQLLFLERQLEVLCLQCEHVVKELECHLRPFPSPNGRTSSQVPRTFLEINIGNVGRVGGHIALHGGTLLEHCISRNSLHNASYETQLWQKMSKDVPRHVWVSVGIQQMTPAESQRVSDLCLELYWEQISRGDHFHVWFAGGIPSEVSTQIEEILMGAFQTRHCLVEGLPKLSQKYPGNNHLRRQVQFYTTSKEMHSRLDHRYLPQEAGSQKGRTPKCNPKFYRYAGGLSQNVARVVGELGTETPMLHEELCSVAIGKRDPEITRLEGEQILKRRRYLHKGPPKADDGYGKNLDTWASIPKEIHLKAPRVGNHIIPPGDPLVLRVQNLVPSLKVHHVEACRGTNRLRIPMLRDNPTEISHRLTVIMHRETGEVKEVGPVEDWTKLPKYKQVRSGAPAKLSLTVFGSSTESPPITTSPIQSQDIQMSNETPSSSVEIPQSRHDPRIAWGPPPVANHGPGFLNLSPQERSELKRVHHNLGHPDPQRMARYLRDGGACEAVIKGALDYQCDSCTESRKGFVAARPGTIHENIAFNTKVGIDLASWKNSKGKEFSFVRFIDEGTMFHLGAECSQGVEGVMDVFENIWANWAGYPQEVYVDPGGEFVSDAWAVRMQEAGIKVNMSASDSDWQLGRAEIHGSTVKRMLSRMDLEEDIDSSVAFQKALRQAFHAKNTLSRVDGYTPQQSVLGISSKLPGSILSDGNASTHSLADSPTTEGQRFLDHLKVRERARKAFIQVDNCSSFRRALLRRTRPSRDDWEVGDFALYWRRRGGNMRREHGRWHGPAQII